MRLQYEIAADEILRRHHEVQMVQLRFETGEVFEPFAVARYQQRRGLNSASRVLPLRALSGPAPSRAFCAWCRGPKKWRGELCRLCEQKRDLMEFERVIEYWLDLERRAVRDFSPKLIDRIAKRERRLGPAAFWPREESVV